MGAVSESGRESAAPATVQPALAERWTTERVLAIRAWTPTLLSFRTTRYRAFRFTPGHYARLGLADAAGDSGASDNAATVIWRPFSMVSAAYDDALEFIAVLVPGGAFSTRLAQLRVGDAIRIEKLSFGFLTLDQVAPGRDLWLLATGSGLGPFLSILREPSVWQKFERLIVVHGVRHAGELAYRDDIAALPDATVRAALNTAPAARLSYVPIVTRDAGATPLAARMPQLLADGRLEQAVDLPLDVARSRLMICGNPQMTAELRQLLGARGFATTRRGVAGQMAFEKYW